MKNLHIMRTNKEDILQTYAYIIFYHVVSYRIVSYHIILCHITFYCIVLCHVKSNQIRSNHTKLDQTILHYVEPY